MAADAAKAAESSLQKAQADLAAAEAAHAAARAAEAALAAVEKSRSNLRRKAKFCSPLDMAAAVNIEGNNLLGAASAARKARPQGSQQSNSACGVGNCPGKAAGRCSIRTGASLSRSSPKEPMVPDNRRWITLAGAGPR